MLEQLFKARISSFHTVRKVRRKQRSPVLYTKEAPGKNDTHFRKRSIVHVVTASVPRRQDVCEQSCLSGQFGCIRIQKVRLN